MEQKKGLVHDVQNLAKLTELDDFEFARDRTIQKWDGIAPLFS